MNQKQEKKIFIVGSGPSSKCPELKNHIEDYEIARINWFFLEKEKIFGNSMNYVFYGEYREAYLYYLYYYLNKKKIYNIANFYLVVSPLKDNPVSVKVLGKKFSSPFLSQIESSTHNYFTNLVQDDYKKLGINISNPTSGLLMLYQLLKVGYKKIKLCGFDFYQTKTSYSLVYNKMLLKNLVFFDKRHVRKVTKKVYIPTPAYKIPKNHSLQADLIALNKILDLFPDAQIEVYINDENVLKIWEKFKNRVKITMLPSPLEKSALYDPYLDKKWFQEATAEFRKKYGKKLYIEKLKIAYKMNLISSFRFIVPKNIRNSISQKIKKPLIKIFGLD